MLLNGDDIIKARDAGEIIIDPFDKRNVNTGSYDVSLGPWYYRQRELADRNNQFWEVHTDEQENGYNPYDQNHIRSTWMLCQAIPEDRLSACISGVASDDLIIPIGPKEIILAHTLEFIGSIPYHTGIKITTQMHSRSSSVRNGIDVCGSGGFGDHGFCSRWTMEIVNTSPRYTAYLVVGRRYAQISFFRTNLIQRDYAKEGKYQAAGKSLADLQKSWHPSMMLPKAYKDWEVEEGTPNKVLIEKLLKLDARPL